MMALPQPLRKSGITRSLSCSVSRRVTTDAGGGGVKTGVVVCVVVVILVKE